ncbi:MAG: YeeE/YedE family protein [Kiritimatiellae bacterium]|nr:YeeE/YedE family protein [Kiritimatiellia bacterium]
MLESLHARKRLQLVLGLLSGIVFGFLLHKGGVTKYDVILGQLLLADFRVLKVMLSAVVVGMVGVHLLKSLGWVRLHPKPGSVGATVIGGLIFGAGFAVLGYCPGTVAGAVGNGCLDALTGGMTGMLIGAGLFAALYGRLRNTVLRKGDFGDVTLPRLLKVNEWGVVLPLTACLILVLLALEKSGL